MVSQQIVNPIKLVYDSTGNPVALAEFSAGDMIDRQYLVLDSAIDGGAITDNYRLFDNVDGGLITDRYVKDNVFFDGGLIAR